MAVEDEISKFYSTSQENWAVYTDHCYAKPYNWKSSSSFLKPTKTLFMPKSIQSKTKNFNPLAPRQELEDIIDVDGSIEETAPAYDVEKTKTLMEECESHAKSARSSLDDDDWELRITRLNWTNAQHRLFDGIVDILDSLYLAKSSHLGTKDEAIVRRTVIDKAVQRLRRLFATVSWDTKTTQWLHQLLIDNLDANYLAVYLDILQSLKHKLPSFVEKMINSPNASLRMGLLNSENLSNVLKKPWEPVIDSINQEKPKKLPGNPIMIFVPSAPTMTRKSHKWMSLLSQLATVVPVPSNFGSSWHRTTLSAGLDQIFSVTKGKVQEVREQNPGRQLILVGMGAGATLALQVAQSEQVMCVISLGFSLLTAEGPRGEPDDNLLELQCPVLFVIGQCSSTSLQEDVEDLRERMRFETGLIVVGSADDNLRVGKKKMREEGITQAIVDRCIVDEIGEFVSGLILSPYPPQIRQSPTTITDAVKKGKNERKRYNSNASSLDSEPPSPTPPRIPRPVGRPPGSKSKSRLEAKWAQQMAQGIPTPASPPPLATLSTTQTPPHTPHSSDTSTATESPTSELPAPMKKIKTLRPVASAVGGAERKATPNSSPTKKDTARIQAYNLNRNVIPGGQLSTLLQGGIKTIPPAQPKSAGSTIKVLEDVTITSAGGVASRLLATPTTPGGGAPKTIDLARLTAAAANQSSIKGGMGGSVVLLPNGKLKAVQGGGVNKVGGGATGGPILMPTGNKYITSKRQLLGKPRTIKRIPPPHYTTATTTMQSALPPPTNLTPNDIMDLPIIFADDNQMIEPSGSSSSSMPTDLTTTSRMETTTIMPAKTVTKIVSASSGTPTNKFLLVTKPGPNTSNFIISQSSVKRPAPLNFSKPPSKYTKIILSKKPNEELPKLSPEITLKRLGSVDKIEPKPQMQVLEAIDLENEIAATTLPNPAMQDIKSITMIAKRSSSDLNLNVAQNFVVEKQEVKEEDEDDPDYVPPKNLKIS